MAIKRLTTLFLIVANGLLTSSLSRAQEKSISKVPRLLNLKKITIGPGDNFQGISDREGSKLIFTHIAGQSQVLYQQNIGSYASQIFLESNEDAIQPALSPSGNFVAYTSFKKNSRGDICYSDLKGKTLDCQYQSQSADSEPFWLSNNKIGFMSRDFSSNRSQLMSWNISTKTSEVLLNESVWSPQYSPTLNSLVYVAASKHNKHGKSLFIRNLGQQKSYEVLIDLPGISSSPRFADDGHIYFTQYINDTNGDHTLDGNDNGVIFRVKSKEAGANLIVFPEQLTSIASNCSYPLPLKNELLLSCAFEGTLDLYTIPLTGIVPGGWDEKLLNDAHMTARSYQDRILLLNNLRFRFPQKYKNDGIVAQIFSNHFLLKEWDAARYYADSLQSAATTTKARSYYDLINIWINIEQETERLPSRQITPEYTRKLKQWQKDLSQFKDHPILQALISLNIQISNRNMSSAKQDFGKLNPQKFTHAIEFYFYNFLAERLFEPGADYTPLKQVLISTMSNIKDNTVAVAYYSMKLLDLISAKPLAERSKEIEQIQSLFPESSLPHKLFLSEKLTLDMIAAGDEKARLAAYKPLDKLMSANRDDYVLNKNIYIRAINNLAAHSLVVELDYIASTWLRYAKAESTEAAYAREQYTLANFDQAYEKIATGRPMPAYGHFFAVVMATDDLEGHFGYIYGTELAKKGDVADGSYPKIVGSKVSESAYRYVQAVTKILRAPSITSDLIDEVLKPIENDAAEFANPAMKYLFLGYLYLEKTLLSRKGFSLDQSAAEKAHHYLMLAYDSGFLNKRIAASALVNLGLLHLNTRNYSLAAKFLAARESLGFASDPEARDYSWYLSKALYYVGDYTAAADALCRGLSKTKDPKITLAFLERKAFYRGLGGKHKEAIEDYKTLYSQLSKFNAETAAKISLNYGYNLLMNKDNANAQKVLEDSLNRIRSLAPRKESDTQLARFEPLRIEATALGLLVKASTQEKVKSQYLEARLSALEKMMKDPSKYYQKKDELLRLQIKLALQLTEIKQSQVLGWERVLDKIEQFLDEGGSILDQSVFSSLKNYYLWNAKNSGVNLGAKANARVEALLVKIDEAFKEVKENQYFLFLSRYKIHSYKILSELAHKKINREEGSTQIKKAFELNQGSKLLESFKADMENVSLILKNKGLG